jgi:DNA topoisomerase-1
MCKFRVRPEDITLNIGEDAPIPVPNMPGKWKAITHDNTVTWLANWTENINGNHKYVFLAAGSSLKGQSDMQKFEKARELKVISNLFIQAYMFKPVIRNMLTRFAKVTSWI